MKDLRLFIICFLIGAGMLFGYTTFKNQSLQPKLNSSKPTPSFTFSIESPPSESLKGSIVSRSGTLLFESRVSTASGEFTNNVPIEQGERLITLDKSTASVNFDQFGSMTLSENADLSFIQTLPVDSR